MSLRLPEEVGTTQGGQVQELAQSVPTSGGGGSGAVRVQAEGTWFQEGVATPVSFCYAVKDVILVVHRDDVTFSGHRATLK